MAEPTLINLRDMPKNGYLYTEPSIKWTTPTELAFQGLNAVVRALSTARAQNPSAGLDPSYAACLESVKRFTAQRLAILYANQPDKLAMFVGVAPEVQAQESQSKPVKKPKKKCATCGKR